MDRRTVHGGKAAGFITGVGANPGGFATLTQAFRADTYRGKRVRWSAWVHPTNVGAAGAGLWMRVDGPGVMLAFDNMADRPIVGTSGWQQVSVVLDVPPNAIGIACGVLLSTSGDIVVDDFRIEVVGTEVPVTRVIAPTPSTDSLTVAASYSRQPSTGVNLDFEELTSQPLSAATIAWLKNAAVPFNTVSPGTDDADLSPLKQMIGSASLVGMGEATHGTREFFQMKHRVFQYLVRQLGFTYFAIEATWPEANDVNTYVLTGKGNPNAALSNLYFWTWRTQEVLDLIQWMREWNLTAPAAQRVQFLGFDMQFPGAAMDTVTAFIARVDPGKSSLISDKYACLVPYRNRGAVFTRIDYSSLSTSARGACADGLEAISQLFTTNRAAYQAASSPAVFANAEHSVRIVEQWQDVAGAGNAGSLLRDRYMAENIQWLRSQAPVGAKMMLWAHNYHVSSVGGPGGTMGNYLRSTYGGGYLNIGFTFGAGSFNAVGGTGTSGGLQSFQTSLVPEGSIESAFVGTGQPRLLFDTRLVTAGGAAAAPLAGPIKMRSIGALYSPPNESGFFDTQIFPGDFDLLIYLANATKSTILPVTQ